MRDELSRAWTRTLHILSAVAITLLCAWVNCGPANAADEQVRQIQQALFQLGYDVGQPDGVRGPRTNAAIGEFLAGEHANPSLSGEALIRVLRNKLSESRGASHAAAYDQVGLGSTSLPLEIVPQVASGGVISAAFSPDGRWILTATGEGAAKLWDAASGRVIRSFWGHSEADSVAFSPDGTQVLTGSSDHTARLWDATSGRLLRSFDTGDGWVLAVAFSPDGSQILAGGTDNAASLWDAGSGRRLRTFSGHFRQVNSVAFSPDGSRILTGSSDTTARLWDAESGQLLHSFEGLSELVSSVAFSPDGSQVFIGSWDNNRAARLWDVAGGEVVRTFDESSVVASAVFSPDGRAVLIGSADKKARLWDAATGRLLRIFEGHLDWVTSVAFSPDGAEVLIGSTDRTLRLWDAANGQLLRAFTGRSADVNSVAVSPDGAQVLTGNGDHTARLWDAASGRLLRTVEGHSDSVTSVAFSRDGSQILTGSWDRTAKLWDPTDGELLRTLSGHARQVDSVAFSPDSTQVLTGSRDKTARLWDATTGQSLRAFSGGTDPLTSVAFSPDGHWILAGSSDAKVRVWDGVSREVVRTFDGDSAWVTSVAYSPDGRRILSGSLQNTVTLWDAASGQLLHTFAGHSHWIASVAFSPDGDRILSGSHDNTAKLWDVTSGKVLQTFSGHSGTVTSVAFSPDGRHILTSSVDSTTRYWDIETGAELASSIAFTDGEWVTITPEGFFDASEHGADNLIVVQGLKSYSIDSAYQALYRPDLVAAKLAGDPDHRVAVAAADLNLSNVIGSGAAPRVVIASPAAGSTIDEDIVEVAADITDQGGGIGKIEWRVNGITLGVETRGFDRLVADQRVADAQPLTVSRTLSLDPGENLVEVVAYNEKGLITSDPASVTVNWNGVSSSTPPKLYLVSVGVNDYFDSRLQLTYAASDARSVAEGFKKAGVGLYESVEVTMVLDADVTSSKLDAVFADLSTKVRPRDVFVLFMAGHGKTQDGRYYFLPADFRYTDEASIAKGGINQDKFQEWLARIPARKSMLLYDTCDSGSLTNGVASRGLEEVAALARMTQAIGRTVLSASTDDAPALEGYYGHGVFTYALLDAFNTGDADQDGALAVTELAGAIDKAVPEISYSAFKLRQIPQMSIVGSDFPIARRMALLDRNAPEPDTLVIPTTPTHVVIVAGKLRASPLALPEGDDLSVGTLVTVLREDGAFSKLARDGKVLGYIETVSLVTAR